MSHKFRPKLEGFEDRVVPAAFSFRMGNVFGTGEFSTPSGYDPTAASQTLAVPDLSVIYNDLSGEVASGATASYVGGNLVGVSATVDVYFREDEPPMWVVQLSGATASVDGASATVAFDKADTEETFYTLAGRGAISYDIPWSQVDPAVENQYLTLSNFNLNIAGQNIGAGYTYSGSQVPKVHFLNGEFQGLVFDLDTSTLADFPFSRLTMTGLDLNYIFNGQTFQVAAAIGDPFLKLDFSTLTHPGAGGYDLTVHWKHAGTGAVQTTVSFANGSTAEQIRDGLYHALKADGANVERDGTTGLTFLSKEKAQLERIDIVPNRPLQGFDRPKAIAWRGANLKYNGEAPQR